MTGNKKDIRFIKLINSKTNESIKICPELGGTVSSIKLGKDLFQILDNDSENDLLNNPLFKGRFLFPFNDRIPDGIYYFKGRKYQLFINSPEDKSAIHGFIYNKEVEVLEQTENSIVMFWRTGRDQIQGYPFDISLKTEIKLQNKGVTISFIVINEGNIPTPFALGWHSYFKTDPSSTLQAVYPYYFEIDENFLAIGDGVLLTGSKFDFTRGASFTDFFLDHTFKAPENGISILINKDYSVKIEQKNFDYTQLFVPPDRKSIAIEPITSKPNSFNADKVLVLEPGEEYCASVAINLI